MDSFRIDSVFATFIYSFQGKKGSLTFKSVEPQVSVFPAMLRTFGTPFFVGSAIKIIYDTLAVFNPQFMKFMIGYVDSQDPKWEAYGVQPEELWKGYFYAMLLLAVTTLQSILLSQYFERVRFSVVQTCWKTFITFHLPTSAMISLLVLFNISIS